MSQLYKRIPPRQGIEAAHGLLNIKGKTGLKRPEISETIKAIEHAEGKTKKVRLKVHICSVCHVPGCNIGPMVEIEGD